MAAHGHQTAALASPALGPGGDDAAQRYRLDKEAFVSDLEGGSILHINAVSLTALTTYALWAALRSHGPSILRLDDPRHALALEYALLVLPLLLATTVLSTPLRLFALNATLSAACAWTLWRFRTQRRALAVVAAAASASASIDAGKLRGQASRGTSLDGGGRDGVDDAAAPPPWRRSLEEDGATEADRLLFSSSPMGHAERASVVPSSYASATSGRSSLESVTGGTHGLAQWGGGGGGGGGGNGGLGSERHSRQTSTSLAEDAADGVIRVSVEAAAEEAHHSAHPPTPYVPPDEQRWQVEEGGSHNKRRDASSSSSSSSPSAVALNRKRSELLLLRSRGGEPPIDPGQVGPAATPMSTAAGAGLSFLRRGSTSAPPPVGLPDVAESPRSPLSRVSTRSPPHQLSAHIDGEPDGADALADERDGHSYEYGYGSPPGPRGSSSFSETLDASRRLPPSLDPSRVQAAQADDDDDDAPASASGDFGVAQDGSSGGVARHAGQASALNRTASLRSAALAAAAAAAAATASTPLPPPPPPRTPHDERGHQQELVPRSKPYLTVYRAHMMLMTVVCILAVDFPAFPREFAKCETWGTSLMDLGVGSFVFSLGLVSASSHLRSASNRFKPLRGQLLRDARKALPLVLLGLVRVVMVKGVEYPEHVAEYGVHWNFFFTLASLPVLASAARPLAGVRRNVRYSTMGIVVSAAHQLLLWTTPLQRWAVANDLPRRDLITANKEGLTSLPGYFAIFLLGLDVGHYALPNDPYLAYRRLTRSRARPKTDKLAMVLASLSVLWWSALGVARLLLGLRVSRRLANATYVVWVVAYNVSFLCAYVTIHLVLVEPSVRDEGVVIAAAPSAGDEKRGCGDGFNAASVSAAAGRADPSWSSLGWLRHHDAELRRSGFRDGASCPRSLQSLNRHSLAVFLVANLLTGGVNLTMRTMYAGDVAAVTVLVTYTATLVVAASAADVFPWTRSAATAALGRGGRDGGSVDHGDGVGGGGGGGGGGATNR